MPGATLPGSVGGRSDSGLSCASLLPVPFYAVPYQYPVPGKAIAYPVTIFLYIFSSATAAFSLWRPASMIELSAVA